MASNKNQHFVPKCYLRPFTSEEAGVVINLYNIDRQKLIPTAPVKSQCSRDYFYGKDESLEKAIQHLEAQYAIALRAIREPSYQLTDEHRYLLKVFWLFQYLRTEEASRRAVAMNDEMLQTAGAPNSDFRLEIREAVQIAMETFRDTMDIMSDMKVCLFKNRTQVPFVTSDDPAILSNRWYLSSPKVRGRSFGLSSAGNILILPLSPTILCLGYDGDVYSVPHRSGWVNVRRQSDVEALNQHQFLNCRANIFVQDADCARIVHEAYLMAEPLRPLQRHRINYAVRDRSEGDYVRYVVVDPSEAGDHQQAMLHTETIRPVPAYWPQHLRWRHRSRVFTNGTGTGYVRRKFAEADSSPPYWQEPARGG